MQCIYWGRRATGLTLIQPPYCWSRATCWWLSCLWQRIGFQSDIPAAAMQSWLAIRKSWEIWRRSRPPPTAGWQTMRRPANNSEFHIQATRAKGGLHVAPSQKPIWPTTKPADIRHQRDSWGKLGQDRRVCSGKIDVSARARSTYLHPCEGTDLVGWASICKISVPHSSRSTGIR